MDAGTDVNFGVLASRLLCWLAAQEGCAVATGHRVVDLKKADSGWIVAARNNATGELRRNRAKFVFVGAGGGSLPLLQRSGIAECRGLGGFPIGGQWLVCDNPEIVRKHHAKVYGQANDARPHDGRAAPRLPLAGGETGAPLWPLRVVDDKIPAPKWAAGPTFRFP